MGLSVDGIAVVGEWIRHAPHRSHPLGQGEDPTSGRWQRGSLVRGLYLADDPETAVAERYRWLAERGLPPGDGVPHDHHRWQVSVEVADLTSPERLAQVGLDMPSVNRTGRRIAPTSAATVVQHARGAVGELLHGVR